MGIVINRPLDINAYELLTHIEIEPKDESLKKQMVFAGGPLQNDRGFVIHPPFGEWQSSLACSDELVITSSRDILDAIAVGKGPERSLIALGYAGWEPGKLENEIAENSWLTSPASSEIIFTTSHQARWHDAAKQLGVEIETLSGDIGHA